MKDILKLKEKKIKLIININYLIFFVFVNINSKWDNKSYILKKLSYSHFIQEENEKSNLLKNENQNDDYQMNSLSRRKD